MKIEKGYYIKARCVKDSKISIAPPYIREIWDWILREANHKDTISSGRKIHRGELVRSFKDIQEDLKWMVGYRKETYKKWQCENAMRVLTREEMITTKKTTRGMLIKVVNYDTYQDPKNYENNNENSTRATREQQRTDTINKNDKNDKNISEPSSQDFTNKVINEFYEFNKQVNYSSKTERKAVQELAKQYGQEELIKMIKHYRYLLEVDTFMPVATTPFEFKKKLAKILIRFKNLNK
jgi:hypothetical protein